MKKLRKSTKNSLVALLLAVAMLVGLVGCGGQTTQTEDVAVDETVADVTETDTAEADVAEEDVAEEDAQAEEEPAEERVPKQVIVYFANWYLDDKEAMQGGEVASIDWENVTFVNHAFWAPYPADGTTESSFERRANGDPARTEFKAVSTFPEADYMDQTPSAVDSSMARNHFAEYAAFSEKYPDVNIMISFGGWTESGYFSEMAYTPEGRASFIQSCMDLMEEYPWIDGIDIDWEYPGGSNDGERYPEDEIDQGCPIWGTKYEDTANFAALCKEFRETMDAKYGAGVKKLTACASASTGWTLPNQDWPAAEPYLDYINIMTYDMAGTWDTAAGHASGLNWVKNALVYYMMDEIPFAKLNIGAPLYGTGLILGGKGELNPSKIVGWPIDQMGYINKDSLIVDKIKEFEAEAVSGYDIVWENGVPVMGEKWDNSEDGTIKGWHFAYDKANQAAYMYNDDETSEYYRWYISYENLLALQAKLDLIEQYNLAGIIVWESSQDTEDHEMIGQMGEFLLQDK